MSTHLHFDLVGGIAGDMTLAALIDAGASLDAIRRVLSASGLPVTAIGSERRWRGGMAGLAITVAPEIDPPQRDWQDIRSLLIDADLPARVRERALGIFERLASVEAQVHGCEPEEVHFHEVGAMDAIVDVVATALALDQLDATSFSCGPIPITEGFIRGDHGTMPLPAPATAVLLTGFHLLPIPGDIETVTPTGAAILATLIPGGQACRPAVRLRSVGTGMGTAELPDRANVLRVLVGDPTTAGTDGERPGGDAVMIEASIDDMDPRLYAETARHLQQAGALDVTLTSLQMKKGRPGTLLSVLCRPELEGVLSGLILRETTTLGVRSHDVRRVELERRHETVSTPFGDVRIKLGVLGDECVNVAPEYDDCERLARERGVPVKDVLAAAGAAAAHRWTSVEAHREEP